MGRRVIWSSWLLLVAERSGRSPRTVKRFYDLGKSAVRPICGEQIELAEAQLAAEGIELAQPRASR
jgi:hypothetical protein